MQQGKHSSDRHRLTQWKPEDPAFWQAQGERIARRNLYISIPALLLAFAVWMVWSVVVAKLPQVGFAYSTDQLFWLAALPGLSGAILPRRCRISAFSSPRRRRAMRSRSMRASAISACQ